MPGSLTCYYLDTPLTADELAELERTLLGPFARFRSGASTLAQQRVPFLVPAPSFDGAYPGAPEERARKLIPNLRHAGIRKDVGRRVAWVMPRDGAWDALFQFAIRLETGLAPYVVQRCWTRQGDGLAEGQVRVFDTQMLLDGLERE